MKFKFRAERKNLIYFGIFAVFLLYVVAIGSLNIYSLVQTSELYGFNPIKAFTPEFIGSTLTFYLIALVGILLQQRSFWEKEKGFGFKTGKPEKGDYSRWAKMKKYKRS